MSRLSFIRVSAFLLLVLLATACNSEGSQSSATATSSVTVRLVCAECAELGMGINLWASPDRSGVVGSVPSGTVARVVDSDVYSGVIHYRVEARGLTGWVSELMVSD